MFDWIAVLTSALLEPLGVVAGTHWGDALQFFVYDSIKIVLLLIVITHLMGLLNTYLPIEKIRKFLTTHKLFGLEYLFASFFGAITPFCTCSSIPLFVGFLKAGIPLGVTFSFLITSPLVNEVALALFLAMFGLKVTIVYMGSGIILGVVGGWLLGKLGLERYLADFIQEHRARPLEVASSHRISLLERIETASSEAWRISIKIVPYILVGVGVGAAIHGFVPTGFFEQYITKSNPFAVPLAVLVGIPMYANATSVLPIVQALIAKGVPLGTGLAFMMAVVGLSLPEFLILKKIMKTKLLLIFFGLVGLCMILLGYLFNWIL